MLEDDYLTLLEARLGYQFKRVIPTLAQRAADNLGYKQVDMVQTFASTTNRLKNWHFTKPYFDFPVYLITQENAPINFLFKIVSNNKFLWWGIMRFMIFLSKNILALK